MIGKEIRKGEAGEPTLSLPVPGFESLHSNPRVKKAGVDKRIHPLQERTVENLRIEENMMFCS
jgi:hypothetical protein